MDQNRADALAAAILSPDPAVKAGIEARRAAALAGEARGRRMALLCLAGAAVGAGLAWFIGIRFTQGALWGGFAGVALGWLAMRRAH